jgi:hypothetical protein
MASLLALAILVFGGRVSAGDVFRGKGGRDKAAVPGGGVITDAAGNRLEIAPTRSAGPAALPRLALPALPTLDDPTAGLAERRRRAQLLLEGTVLGAIALVAWARRRWRPGA